ncbi:MAG: transcription termination/antitermination factor NusG [Clostridia bacterium]|nr:transcription termination/antitermination factor NusG [Clostridia bacterium]MBR0348100.1 transcription termination/antitermination factor NusG [Clostridia bacterium]
MSNDSRWYVVHTYSGYENKVATNILKAAENRKMQDEIFEVKIPTETVVEVREDGKTREVERKIFPGYVMVKIATFLDENDMPKISDEAWLVIRGTRGATGFVGPEGKPVPLTEEEVYRLGVEKKVVEVKYEVGDTVNIIDEIFEGFSGTVEEIDLDNNKVKVTVSALFGKETLVELELDQVEVVTD